jgi:hypothetical protein
MLMLRSNPPATSSATVKLLRLYAVFAWQQRQIKGFSEFINITKKYEYKEACRSS